MIAKGLFQEQNTIIEYRNQHTGTTVQKLRLMICYKYPYLAASTDGLIIGDDRNDGILPNSMQLNIVNYNWCDFVVKRVYPYEMFVERIFRDSDLWDRVIVIEIGCILPYSQN